MREIVLDTETTGVEANNGDRIVEIGCVELLNHCPSGRTFHVYINPERSMPIEAFNGMRAGVLADRSQFLKDLSGPFYGANRPNAKVSQAILDAFWLQGMQAGLPGILASIKAFSESDHTDDLKTIDVPTLILHGDDDQIVPVAASAMVSATLVKGSTLKVYPGFSNGMCTVNKDQINTDLLAFIRSA